MKCRAVQKRKVTYSTNPLSGHTITTVKLLEQWEVFEPYGLLPREVFTKEEKANAYAIFKDGFNRKFPFDCPRTEKEKSWTSS